MLKTDAAVPVLFFGRPRVAEIMEIAAKGIVHACICPYAEDVHNERCLMIASSSSELTEAAYQAAMDI